MDRVQLYRGCGATTIRKFTFNSLIPWEILTLIWPTSEEWKTGLQSWRIICDTMCPYHVTTMRDCNKLTSQESSFPPVCQANFTNPSHYFQVISVYIFHFYNPCFASFHFYNPCFASYSILLLIEEAWIRLWM